jgi:hypothetical protein
MLTQMSIKQTWWMEHSLLQFMVFSMEFSSKEKPKNDKRKKNHLMNLDKSFCTCLMWLGNQIGPCRFDWQNDRQND